MTSNYGEDNFEGGGGGGGDGGIPLCGCGSEVKEFLELSGREGSQASTLPSDLEREVRLNTGRRRKEEQMQLSGAIAALLKTCLHF